MLVSTIIYVFTLAVSFALASNFFIHIYQLEAYHKSQYVKWVCSNFLSAVAGKSILMLACFVGLIISTNTYSLLVCSAANLLTAFYYRPKKAKKPLIYTPRIKRLFGTVIVIFALLAFVCLYFKVIFVMPLLVAFASVIVYIASLINTPIEKAVQNGFISDAKRILKSHRRNLTVIGITGSYGKTSTKFYLEKILSKKYNVLMTPGSYNTTMGVVRVIREMLKPTHEIFICEMGARHLGDVKEICDIVMPDMGIITSVGPQHLETFKSIENVTKAKFELADSVSEKGFVVLNGDNEYITSRKIDKKAIYYGIDNKNAEFFADNIKCTAAGTSFTLHYGGNTAELSTRLLGAHNVLNILAACAMAIKLDVDLQDIKSAVRMLETVPHRLEIVDGGNAVIIDDAFNSNPSGAKFALDVLDTFEGLKALVTPGMVELGEKQYELNKVFGAQAADVCDYIYIVGKLNYESIKAGAVEKGFAKEKIKNVSSPQEGVALARAVSSDKQKIVLLENDLPDNFK